jgi:TrmH family RNA methyltransferase
MGALFWKPIVRGGVDEFFSRARREGLQLIGTSARGGVDPQGYAPRHPWILVMGNEQKGLSAEQLGICDAVITLQMQGRASSLNLAVAAGILLYQMIGDVK